MLKEMQSLINTRAISLKRAEKKAEELRIQNKILEALVRDISRVIYEKGQGTIVNRLDKIKLLVDDYQSNN